MIEPGGITINWPDVTALGGVMMESGGMMIEFMEVSNGLEDQVAK